MQDLQIRPLTLPQDRALLGQALRLHRRVLGPLTRADLWSRLRGRRPILLVALLREKVVGYKFGYEDRPGHFYSWLGGVHPKHRRQGIAQALMKQQHGLLEQRGYRRVRTQTTNRRKPMLLLNLRAGFDVIGTWTSPKGLLRIILEKAL